MEKGPSGPALGFPPRRLRGRNDVDVLAIAAGRKLDRAVGQREERMIPADPNIKAGVKAGTPLPDDNVARDDPFAAETLDAQTLSVGVAAVTGGTGALLGSEQLKVEQEHSRVSISEARGAAQTLAPHGATVPPMGGLLFYAIPACLVLAIVFQGYNRYRRVRSGLPAVPPPSRLLRLAQIVWGVLFGGFLIWVVAGWMRGNR